MKTDVLIIGTGIAGLSCALRLAELQPSLSIWILDKSGEKECNTKYAQGGLAAVLDRENDSFGLHVHDTLEAGKGKSNPEVVRYVIRRSPEAIGKLENWGVKFDRKSDGAYFLGKEGGHTANRIVHHTDRTGNELHEKLWQKLKHFPGIKVFQGLFALDLCCSRAPDRTGTCWGISALNLQTRLEVKITAQFTVLATGGSGQLFSRTTNPAIATGDGLAMAIRAGVKTRDLSYFQFHPTALYQTNSNRALLITEALRGAGAYLVNHQEERFLFRKDPRGELATRDVVTAAIQEEISRNGIPYVFLDARHLGKRRLDYFFPQVVENCLTIGLHPGIDLIPVCPAAHYQCGGIRVDLKARTSIHRLLALGECASTGLHGQNRLASNSLTEAVVFAEEAARYMAWEFQNNRIEHIGIPADNRVIPPWASKPSTVKVNAQMMSLLHSLKKNMTHLLLSDIADASDAEALKIAILDWQDQVKEASGHAPVQIYLWEIKNLLEVAREMVDDVLKNKRVPC